MEELDLPRKDTEEAISETASTSLLEISFCTSMMLAEAALTETKMFTSAAVVLASLVGFELAEYFEFRIIWIIFTAMCIVVTAGLWLQIRRSREKFKEMVELREALKDQCEKQIRLSDHAGRHRKISKKNKPYDILSELESMRFLLRMEEINRFMK